jgi:uncharacterized RDD family membrane protein YckC
MKCPKCLYIGFETGERCKNCGYDFSLLAMVEEPEAEVEVEDLRLRPDPADELPVFDVSSAMDDTWTGPAIDRFRELADQDAPALALSLAGPGLAIDPVPARTAPVSPPPAVAPAEPALPLFAPDAADDEPLVKLPAVPRVPLAVRKTPEVARLRHTRTPDERRPHEDPVLQFVEPDDEPVGVAASAAMAPEPATIRPSRGAAFLGDTFVRSGQAAVTDPEVSPFGRRVVAAVIDHAILLSIDFVVIYFTLRLTELSLADWHLLPVLPMAAFLLLLKVAYLSAFTTAGGQTIGKMATHIRVVSDDGGQLDPGRALRRAVLGLVSIVAAGAPFLTALTDPARRGVHDRASGTRVVALAPR